MVPNDPIYTERLCSDYFNEAVWNDKVDERHAPELWSVQAEIDSNNNQAPQSPDADHRRLTKLECVTAHNQAVERRVEFGRRGLWNHQSAAARRFTEQKYTEAASCANTGETPVAATITTTRMSITAAVDGQLP